MKLKKMPDRPVVGYRQLSEILHRTPRALIVARHKGRLPLDFHYVGRTIVFDLDQVRAFAKAYRPVRRCIAKVPTLAKPAKAAPEPKGGRRA